MTKERNNRGFVNKQEIQTADVRTKYGIIHGLQRELLQQVKSRCNVTRTVERTVRVPMTSFMSSSFIPSSYKDIMSYRDMIRSGGYRQLSRDMFHTYYEMAKSGKYNHLCPDSSYEANVSIDKFQAFINSGLSGVTLYLGNKVCPSATSLKRYL